MQGKAALIGFHGKVGDGVVDAQGHTRAPRYLVAVVNYNMGIPRGSYTAKD
jgi:hypothetical protein